MSGFERDFEQETRVKKETNVMGGNYDDFERLDNYALHEQPEAEERESKLTSSSFGRNDDEEDDDVHVHHPHRQIDNGGGQHGDDLLLLNLSKTESGGDRDELSSFLTGFSSSSVLHSTSRPLMTTEHGPSSPPPPPPEMQVCSKPVPETMEIHLTPDPDELRAAEPFVNITGADNYEEESQHRDDDPFAVRSKYVNDDDDEDDLDPVYEQPRQTGHRYVYDDDDDDDMKTSSRHRINDDLDPFSPSAPPQRQEPLEPTSSSFSHHHYKEEIEEITMSSDDLTQDTTANVTFQTQERENDEQQQQMKNKNLLEEEEEEEDEGRNELETPKLCVCPPKTREEVFVPKKVDGRSKGQCIGLSAWFKAESLDPRVAELIYWRDVKKTGAVFGTGLTVLLSLTYFSLISVLAYSLLAVVVGTISYRIYKNVLQAVQKSGDGHPFKAYLEMELNLPEDKLHEVAEITVAHLESIAKKLRRLFLVEDIVDSLKFAVMLWCFTYVGAWFNGLTLFILAFVALFTLPKVYETYKSEIDHYVEIAATQVNGILSKVKAKIPIGKKPKEQ